MIFKLESICDGPGTLLTTDVEHKSIEQYRRKYGNSLTDIRNLEHECKINPNTKLVSIISINNVVGLGTLIPSYPYMENNIYPIMHTDAVQMFGRVRFSNLYECITFSAHKLHGPKGVAGLWIDKHTWDIMKANPNKFKFKYQGTLNAPCDRDWET